jgi:hypothetical protein
MNEELEEIHQSLTRSPMKSARRLAKELNVCRELCRKALHNLSMKAHKINVAHQLLPPDFEKHD